MASICAKPAGGCAITAICLALILSGCAGNDDKLASYNGLKALEHGDWPRAVENLEQAVRRANDPARAAFLQNHLGIALARAGRPDDAMVALGTAHNLAPTMPEPAYNLGVINLELERTATAEEWFLKASDLAPDDTMAMEYLSDIRRRQGDLAQARGYLMEAHRRQPHLPRILAALGLVELQADNLDQASMFLQQCLEKDPAYPPAVYNLALVRQRQENLIQARSLFHEYTRLSGTSRTHLELAAQAMDELNRQLNATAMFGSPAPETAATLKPVEIAPPSTEALARIAQLLENQGRAEAAVNNYLLAARAAERAGDEKTLRAMLRSATLACSENSRAHYNVGMYYLEKKRPEDALLHFKKAVALDDQWFAAHLALARVAMEQSEYDAALVSLKIAVNLRPDDPNALWSLTQLYDRSLNMAEQSARHYEMFLERFPEDVRARYARQRLDLLRQAGTI